MATALSRVELGARKIDMVEILYIQITFNQKKKKKKRFKIKIVQNSISYKN